MMIFISLAIAAVVVGLDQLLKYLVVANLKGANALEIIPNIFKITYTENKGVAFGMFQDARLFFIIFTSVVIVLILFLLIKYHDKSKLFCVACGLIIGGGIGNLIDRIFLGYVVDFLSLSFFPPVCNFADYAITAGTILIIIYLLFFTKSDKKGKQDGQSSI